LVEATGVGDSLDFRPTLVAYPRAAWADEGARRSHGQREPFSAADRSVTRMRVPESTGVGSGCHAHGFTWACELRLTFPFEVEGHAHARPWAWHREKGLPASIEWHALHQIEREGPLDKNGGRSARLRASIFGTEGLIVVDRLGPIADTARNARSRLSPFFRFFFPCDRV
jgi:hypothetical protein